MKHDYSHLDKVFAQRLKGRKKAVPTQVWESIEHSLDKKKKNLFPIWLQWGAAAAVLFLVFQLGYQWSQYTDHSTTIVEAKFEKQQSSSKSEKKTNNKVDTQTIKRAETTKSIKLIERKRNNINKTRVNNSSPIKINKKIKTKIKEVQERQRSQRNLNYLSPRKTKLIFASLNPHSIKRKNPVLVSSTPNQQKEEKMYSYTGTERKNKSMAFGISAAPSYSYRKLSANTLDGVTLSEHYDGQENGMNQYAAMAEMNYELNSRISVQIGLSYNTFGYQDSDALSYAMKGKTYHLNQIETSASSYAITKKEAYQSLSQIANLSQNMKGEEDLKTAILTQEFSYLQFPVSLGFSLLRNENFNTKLLSGLSPGYMIKEKSSLEYDGENIPLQSIESFNKKIISGLLGFAFQYKLSDHIQLKIQPMLNYAFSSLINHPDYNIQNYSWNIFGGIHYKIN